MAKRENCPAPFIKIETRNFKDLYKAAAPQPECFQRAISADNAICYKSLAHLLLLLVPIKDAIALAEARGTERFPTHCRSTPTLPFNIWLFKLQI